MIEDIHLKDDDEYDLCCQKVSELMDMDLQNNPIEQYMFIFLTDLLHIYEETEEIKDLPSIIKETEKLRSNLEKGKSYKSLMSLNRLNSFVNKSIKRK